jgi:hypothetical protein
MEIPVNKIRKRISEKINIVLNDKKYKMKKEKIPRKNIETLHQPTTVLFFLSLSSLDEILSIDFSIS